MTMEKLKAAMAAVEITVKHGKYQPGSEGAYGYETMEFWCGEQKLEPKAAYEAAGLEWND